MTSFLAQIAFHSTPFSATFENGITIIIIIIIIINPKACLADLPETSTTSPPTFLVKNRAISLWFFQSGPLESQKHTKKHLKNRVFVPQKRESKFPKHPFFRGCRGYVSVGVLLDSLWISPAQDSSHLILHFSDRESHPKPLFVTGILAGGNPNRILKHNMGVFQACLPSIFKWRSAERRSHGVPTTA